MFSFGQKRSVIKLMPASDSSSLEPEVRTPDGGSAGVGGYFLMVLIMMQE